jgi:anti-anti-sigma factor
MTAIPGFHAEMRLEGMVAVISITGYVPKEYVSETNERITALTAGRCRYVILDCSKAERASSKALGLVAYHATALRQRGGAFLFVPPAEAVVRRYRAELLAPLVQFVSSREEGLAQVAAALGVGAGQLER